MTVLIFKKTMAHWLICACYLMKKSLSLYLGIYLEKSPLSYQGVLSSSAESKDPLELRLTGRIVGMIFINLSFSSSLGIRPNSFSTTFVRKRPVNPHAMAP